MPQHANRRWTPAKPKVTEFQAISETLKRSRFIEDPLLTTADKYFNDFFKYRKANPHRNEYS